MLATPREMPGRPARKLKALRRLRQEHALTQQELADQAGVKRSTISLLETELHGGSAKTVRALAKALGVTPIQLYGDEPGAGGA
jgi:transcriptional regulator with XRE-family HTH domain